MTTVKQFLSWLNQKYPFGLQESYDNTGLLVGNYGWEIKGVLISLDITEEVVKEAIEKKCNVILAHHPLIFKGLKKITGQNYIEKSIITAIKNDIAIIASHTNTDSCIEGTNYLLATKLGLQNLKILKPQQGKLKKIVTFVPDNYTEQVRKALFEAGAGVIGNYDQTSFSVIGEGTFRGNENTNPFVGEPNKLHTEKERRLETIYPDYLHDKVINALLQAHPYEEVAYDIYTLENINPYKGMGIYGKLTQPSTLEHILTQIKKHTKIPCLKYAGNKDLNKLINKIAICGGTCISALPDAKKAGVDIFITSDIKYHEFFDAGNNITLVDIGHYEAEYFVKETFFNSIKENFSNFATYLSETNTNPVNYF